MALPHRPALLAFIAGLLLIGGAWLILREALDSRMARAAQRGLDTIVDLVAAELRHAAANAPHLRGRDLLDQVSRADRELTRNLQRADGENFRRIYFFDAAGRTFLVAAGPGGPGWSASPSTDIVRRALAGQPVSAGGAQFEPYRGHGGGPAIGVWRWLADPGLGVVAERPYDRYAFSLVWVDGTFAVLMAIYLLAGAWYLRRGAVPFRPDRDGRLTTCGPYSLIRRIGEGCMSTVYLARHRQLRRTVALKLLKPHAQSDELAARFEREVRLASRLAHPNIITILDYGRAPGGGFYYTMEYIHGLTLTQWVERHGAVEPDRAIRLLRQLCSAVSAMHGHHLLHRDIKPDNVMAYAAHDDCDLLKLLDFGLIKDLGLAASRDLTRDVRVLGTPAFMAPERLLDPRLADPRTDLYGIGCIGYYLLTGHRPFEATQEGDLMQQVLHIDAPAVSALAPHGIPERLDRLIADALAKDMARRPASAAAFMAILDEIAVQLPWRREVAMQWWRELGPDAERPAGATAAGRHPSPPARA